jgi:hypothetical protein
MNGRTEPGRSNRVVLRSDLRDATELGGIIDERTSRLGKDVEQTAHVETASDTRSPS